MKFLKEALLEIIEQVEASEEAQRRIKKLEQRIRDLENASYGGKEDVYCSALDIAGLNDIPLDGINEEALKSESWISDYYIVRKIDGDTGEEVNAYHINVWRKFFPSCACM
jgi:hypothetical protein